MDRQNSVTDFETSVICGTSNVGSCASSVVRRPRESSGTFSETNLDSVSPWAPCKRFATLASPAFARNASMDLSFACETTRNHKHGQFVYAQQLELHGASYAGTYTCKCKGVYVFGLGARILDVMV